MEMANVIKLKKGLDIPLEGQPNARTIDAAACEYYALVPDDFHGIVPKVLVKTGDAVSVGTPLMCDKNNPALRFVSPVSGEVSAVTRGERRKVLDITVKSDGQMTQGATPATKPVGDLSADEIKELLLANGLFMFIKQRPYDIIAAPTDTPRDIFVTAWDSAPLAPDFDYILAGREADLQTGIDVL